MAAKFVLNLASGLYQAVTDNGKEAAAHENDTPSPSEENYIVDVKRLVSVGMPDETKQMAADPYVMDDLRAHLDECIDSWSQPNDEELAQRGAPVSWARQLAPQPAPSAPEQPQRAIVKDGEATKPKLADPTVGIVARYIQQWNGWAASPTVDSPAAALTNSRAPWRMQQQTHYPRSRLPGQGQLACSGSAAQLNRAPGTGLRASSGLSSAREVRMSHRRQAVSNMSQYRTPRSSLDVVFVDEDYDPQFWQKNLRPGNIWTDPPRFPIPPEDNISPRTGTVPRDWL